MGLFGKLFEKPDKPMHGNITPVEQELSPCTSEQELLERYGGIALYKQIDFEEIIGDNNWNVDIKQGTISFGPSLVFPIQVLGTISHASQSWLWAWANTQSGLSETITQQSRQLKKYGEDYGIDLLRSDTFGFSKEELHLIGMIASGMFNASAYYIADYGQGAMVVTINDSRIDNAQSDEQLRHLKTLTFFPKFIAQFDLNHKSAFKSFLRAKGYQLTESENVVAGTKNGNNITGQFDEQGRLTKIKG